jgi:hypothetical protein
VHADPHFLHIRHGGVGSSGRGSLGQAGNSR